MTNAKRILVTGAPGWLGNRLVEVLQKGFDGDRRPFQGAQVRCLVLPGMNVSSLQAMGVETVEGDITRRDTLDKALADVDLVYHLAGIIHPKWRTRDLFAINTDGTRNVLDAAIEAGAERFVMISSNSVGGTNRSRDHLMSETDAPNPYLKYGQSKHLAEKAVNAAYGAGKIETVILRPCWFYGPGQPMRQTRLFKMIKAGNPLVFGDGSNLRSMSYLDNTVQGMILSGQEKIAAGKTYWMADERPYSTMEIYETIAKILGVKELKPRFLPNLVPSAFYLADNVLQTFGLYQIETHVAGEMNKHIACSVEKAKRELGYTPKVDLEEGMRRSIAWCRANGVDI